MNPMPRSAARHYQARVFNPGTCAKCTSLVANGKSCCLATAAIQRSLSGMGCAKPGEFGLHLAVHFGGVLVGEQNHGVCQKVVDVCELFLPPLRPLRAKVKFTKHYPRQVHGGDSGEVRTHDLVTAKVRDHDVGVHQDTTSHVH